MHRNFESTAKCSNFGEALTLDNKDMQGILVSAVRQPPLLPSNDYIDASNVGGSPRLTLTQHQLASRTAPSVCSNDVKTVVSSGAFEESAQLTAEKL